MLKDLKQYWKKLKGVHLSTTEKRDMYHKIAFFMAQNPIPVQEKKRSFFHSFLFVKRPFAFATLIVFLVAFSGAGISYASENAQPGDFLYPVKVNVNEEVVSALQFTPKGKSEWEMERIRRRFKEVEKLAENGKLTPELEAKITQNLAKHTQHVQNFITKFESDGEITDAEQTITDMQSVFDEHQQILSKLSGNEDGTPGESFQNSHVQKPPLEDVINIIKENGGKLPPLPLQQNDGTSIGAKPFSEKSDEKQQEIIGKQMSKLQERIAVMQEVTTSATDETNTALNDKITAGQELSTQAQDAMDAGNYELAENLLQKALQITENAKGENKEINSEQQQFNDTQTGTEDGQSTDEESTNEPTS